MKNFWQPEIDGWVFENININNTTSHTTSYSYAPNEGEEDIHITGVGKLKPKELKEKIKEKLQGLVDLIHSDNISDIERVYHSIESSPELSNLLKQYIDGVKNYRKNYEQRIDKAENNS